MLNPQPKLMYFGQLPPDRSREAFRSRWRQHGTLGMSLPFWRLIARYTQFDALTSEEIGEFPTAVGNIAEDGIGGVGAVWYKSEEGLASIPDDPGLETMRIDELEVFGGEIHENFFATREQVHFAGGGSVVTMVALIYRAPGLTRQEFVTQWLDQGGRLAETELVRSADTFVQNQVWESWPTPPAAEGDGILELGFRSAEEMTAFFDTPASREMLEAEFIDSTRYIRVITKENVLFSDAESRV